MNKIAVAVLLIAFGILLLLKNSNMLPVNFCSFYLELAANYWPVLIVLFGANLLIKDKYWEWSRVIIWVIILLVGFWLFCTLSGQNNWVI